MIIASYVGTPSEIQAYLRGRDSLSEVKLESAANEYLESIRRWSTAAEKVLSRLEKNHA